MITKSDLVASTVEKAGFTSKDCEKVIDAFIEAVSEAIATRDEVSLYPFGKFGTIVTKATPERTMTSGLTGKEVVIPAKGANYKPVFKTSKKLKELVALKDGEAL